MAAIVKNEQDQEPHIRPIGHDGGKVRIGLTAASQGHTQQVRCIAEELPASCNASASDMTAWLVSAPNGVRGDGAGAGFHVAHAKLATPTLAAWVRTYRDSRSDVQSNTRANYRKTERDLLGFFGGETQLDQITAGQAEEFRIWMKSTRGLADATVRRRCKQAKQFFKAAVEARLLTKNPFQDVPSREIRNLKRLYFVSREEAEAVLNACPTAEWRLVFALARYGGLRCPSEVTRMRWEDIDWARKRFTVRKPKTNCRYGSVRQVPLFPELRPYLQAVLEQAKKDVEYVLTGSRRSNTNLAGYLCYCMTRVGLKPWPKLFLNLRYSRQIELAGEFPPHIVGAWMGNLRGTVAQDGFGISESLYEKASAGTTALYPASQQHTPIPDISVQGWTSLPESTQRAILTLVSMACGTASRNPPASGARDETST